MARFQCTLDDLYKAGKRIGTITAAFSLSKETKYSLFQKFNERSAT